MSLIEREAALKAERLRRSRETFDHDGAAIPDTSINWREEALALEAQVAGAVDLLRRIHERKAGRPLTDTGSVVEWIDEEIAAYIREHGPLRGQSGALPSPRTDQTKEDR